MALAHTAHLSAQMRRVQVNCDPMRLEHAHQLVRDLHADALLHSEAAGEDPYETGQLGDADDLLMRDVADVGVPMEGQRMVLAEREELDWTLDDLADRAVRAAVTLRGERGQELGIALVSERRVVHRPQETRRRVLGAGSIKIHPEGHEDLGRVTLELLPPLRRDRPRSRLLPARC